MKKMIRPTLLALSLCSALLPAQNLYAHALDHAEFSASLQAPFRALNPAGNQARQFTLHFEYPHADTAQAAVWRVQLLDKKQNVIQTWYGADALPVNKKLRKNIQWQGRNAKNALPDGIYTVQMEAVAIDMQRSIPQTDAAQLFAALQKKSGLDWIQQSWPMQVGMVTPQRMPLFQPLAGKRGAQRLAPATAGLPYSVYYGNLHSQTNHSDGGGENASCSHAVAPQRGAYGPTDAYAFAHKHGLDFLLTSEHNHLFDGSANSANANADAAVARARYQSGLKSAADYNAKNKDFLGLYGMEWGVISNGGHLNIMGAQELLGWEYNNSQQLIGDTFIARNDYAALYTLMKQKNWIGQFNHPEKSGQFLVNGKALGYHADGDQVMVLCEVMNSSAFSNVTDESDGDLSSFESACNKLLENGYHIAFSSNQDNHCANWGASAPNRTGVLLPAGSTLNQENFLAALKARRVFATMDKNAQIVLQANGRMMGERFTNRGPLNFTVSHANSNGKQVASVQIIEGVPGVAGSTALLGEGAQQSITPKAGAHFYYAKLTQDDGKIMWSAPIWVTQEGDGGGDTQAPNVSAAVSGSSGTLQFSAKASDNVGVSKLEFYVDGALQGTLTQEPFTLAFDSTKLSNGAHSLQARACDAAANCAMSAAVSFTVSNVQKDSTPPQVSAKVSGSSGMLQLSANASDNVGVVKVEFAVDGVSRGSLSSAPWQLALDSTTLANGAHKLQATAFDAAGNKASAAADFTVNNSGQTQELLVNGDFEKKTSGWKTTSGVINNDANEAAHGGQYKAWLNGYGEAHTDSLAQSVSLPASLSSAQLSFWLKISTEETVTTLKKDTLTLTVRNSSGKVLATLGAWSNLDKSSYKKLSYDLSQWKGQSVQIHFEGVENSSKQTSFLIDDASLTVK
ncbi:Ig-like domain-containing protein [Massilia sp. W12]|uniref:Ig-like domain-containing protein n=1 Tax=Massilia sp. W12 TaxID=3126507 RepID=UPI0030CD0837